MFYVRKILLEYELYLKEKENVSILTDIVIFIDTVNCNKCIRHKHIHLNDKLIAWRSF